MNLRDPHLKYLPAPDPNRYLPWKIAQKPPLVVTQEDIDTALAEARTVLSKMMPGDRLTIEPLYEHQPRITIELTPMSRKHDRSKLINEAAFELMKGSIRRKPWWFPKFLWIPIYRCASRIVFK